MTTVEYIKSRGLTVRVVAQKMGVTRQAISDYDKKKFGPTLRRLEKLATTMTALGAETSIADLTKAICSTEVQ